MKLNFIVRMMGQSIRPVFGGHITQFFGSRAIFWFLFIFGATSLGTMILLLPETFHCIAGNRTIRLTGFQKPLIYSFKPQPDALIELDDVPKGKGHFMTILAPLPFLFSKDVSVSQFFTSIVCTGMLQCPLAACTIPWLILSLIHSHLIDNSPPSRPLQPHRHPSRPGLPPQRPHGPRLQAHRDGIPQGKKHPR
jgi:MFS family permease